jgi:hypothetical protein
MHRRLHALIAMVATILTLLGLSGVPDAAHAAHGPHTEFTSQASSLGLTDTEQDQLQVKVDDEVRRTHGKQVALNEVHWSGGSTVFVLPGETYARHLTDGVQSRVETMHRCPYKYFCTYTKSYWEGTMHELYHCRYYSTPYDVNSWSNNQTKGTRARFYDYRGRYFYTTYGAPWDAHWETKAGQIYSIKPC